MFRLNENEIKALFSNLLADVRRALQSQSDISIVREFLTNLFRFSLPETSNFGELFTTVTVHGLWNYWHFSPLEELANHLLHDNQEVQGLIKAYKARLSGFYLTTRLIDYIMYMDLDDDDSDEECDQLSLKLTTKEYRKMKVVLRLDRKISQVSLDYVAQLWQSFREEYEIPSLKTIIYRILAG